ncbi:cell division protein FtsZ [Rickettsia rhipicephali str. 3-7-female6-CWPP]|uniref:Cell division protein FtsZ n=1 Tax=Rickettsia rhipicephali (strain 3-7-female6-CWPP) TaxID=1105113 RepID=A0AAI8AAB3_RICR3|nr:cell division protein FtsZ [Rickettsia rhipicephali]AFC72746.1 cell division protein FtsZ [Rickettsia rhipicephali str. 3-7-female6-CWPP]
MVLNIKAPENIVLKPTITVFGVGGAGSNAVNNMISANLQGANFVVANTDAQSLEHSLCTNKIQLGVSTTRGLGAGASPEVGALAAQESESEIRSYLENSNMVFITAGMGGGTGTGSAPVIARIAKELGILTVGVVTKPFHFEGGHRMKTADKGLIELQQFVDTLIVIPNQNLFRIANEQTTFADAFKMADDVLHAGVRGVTDLMIMPGLINLDFADIKAIMSEMGKAMMGTGEASGEDRAIKAAESAISNPLLDHSSMCGARGVLINITGGSDMTLFEVDNAANRIREEVDNLDANIIFGSTFNPELKGIIRVSVVATGIDADKVPTYKTAIAETTNIVPEKTYNKAIAQPTQIEEIPDFNSYSTENIEITDSPINQNFIGNEKEPGLHANTFNKSEDDSPKPSFLGKIWGSLRTSNHQTLERKNVVVSTLDQDNKESDIHDIPAFLRKKRD